MPACDDSVKVMKLFLAASIESFDLKAALLAGHAQHPVIVHFPIALFIASVSSSSRIWRKQPVLASVAYFNLLGAAMTVPFAIATGLARGDGSSKARPSKAIYGCI